MVGAQALPEDQVTLTEVPGVSLRVNIEFGLRVQWARSMDFQMWKELEDQEGWPSVVDRM